MNEVEGRVIRRIAVQMKQRQCRDVAHAPSIFEPAVDSYASEKSEAPHRCAGLPKLFTESAVLSVPTTGHLAAVGHLDQASAGHPAAVGHLDRASAGHPAAVDHLAADQASGSDSDSLFIPLQYWFATSIARFPWRESIHG